MQLSNLAKTQVKIKKIQFYLDKTLQIITIATNKKEI